MSILAFPDDYLARTAFYIRIGGRSHEISAPVLCTEEKTPDAMSKSECEALLDATSAYCEVLQKSGQLIVAEPLEPVHMAMTVRVRNGKLSVTDGPFAETKELIAGYWLWQCQSKEEAIEWVKRCPNPRPGEESEIEIRQVFEAEDFGAEFTPELRTQEERLRAQSEQPKKAGGQM